MRDVLQAVIEAYTSNTEAYHKYGWTVTPAARGMNGLVYHAEPDQPDNACLGVKISRRDARERSTREYTAMQTLWDAGINDVCAKPCGLFLDVDDLPGDVVIYEWLLGSPLSMPAEDDHTMWLTILRTFSRLHQITPATSLHPLQPAALHVRHPVDLLMNVSWRRASLPTDGLQGALTLSEIDAVIDRLTAAVPTYWPYDPPLCLVICDSNRENMIEDQGQIRLVDWSNSGWSDPAYDVADMCTQPSFFGLSSEHQAWLHAQYAEMQGDVRIEERATVYETAMVVEWILIMTQQRQNIVPEKIPGVRRYSSEYFETFQTKYWDRVLRLLGMNDV